MFSPREDQHQAATLEARLSKEHYRTLVEGSAIDPGMLLESGAHTILRSKELPHQFSERQRRRAPGVLFITHRPNDETSYIFRPDEVDPEKQGHRYEQPCKSRGAPGNTLDVPQSLHHLIEDTSVPVIFVEGTKKMLSVVSAATRENVAALVVGVSGVWNWMADGEPIPDMLDIPVEGRNVTICFDSDMLHKIEVQEAAKALAKHLEERGARMFITYFHDAPDGSKVGADDFFVAGGTFAELRLLTRRYDPTDFKRVRLSRSLQLRLMCEDLRRTYEAMPATKPAELSMRAAIRHIIPRAETSGKANDDGILVHIPSRPLANDMCVSQETARKTLRRLEEHCYLQRVPAPQRKVEEHGALYLLYANCTERTQSCQDGTERRIEENETPTQQSDAQRACAENPLTYGKLYGGDNSPCTPHADVPELRNSKVIHTWARRDGQRVVVDSDYTFRLGKQAWEIVAYLLDRGGSASDGELLERFGTGRTVMRNFRRRRLSPLAGYRYAKDKETGKEVRQDIGPPIVAYGDGVVSILPEWREALEVHRRATDEDGDAARQRKRYREQSEKYRNRDKSPADEPGPLLGKTRVQRMTEEDRRKAREEKAHKAKERVREAFPNHTLFRKRKAGLEARDHAWRGDGLATPSEPIPEDRLLSGPAVMASWISHPVSAEHPLDCEHPECMTSAPCYVKYMEQSMAAVGRA